MFSARMQKLAIFILLGCKVRLGSALPKPIIRDQHNFEPEMAATPTTPGTLEARTKPVNYSEAYSQLLDLLHETSGDFVATMIKDPEWLARVCAQTCEYDDQTCHQSCGNNVGYLDSDNIDRCAIQCEHIPHDGVAPLQGEYGACLVPCLKERHDIPVDQQTHQKDIAVKNNVSVTVSDKTYDYIDRNFPYYVTLMDDTSTTVVEVIGPAPTIPLTEDDGLKTLTPTMSTPTSNPTQNNLMVDLDQTKKIDPHSEQKGGPSFPAPENMIAPGITYFEDEITNKGPDTTNTIEDVKPTPTMVDTDTTTTESIDVIPSKDSLDLADVEPMLGSVLEITPVLVEISASVEEVTLITSIVDLMEDLEVSYSRISKTFEPKLNATNTTAISTGSSKPTVTSETEVAEGAASLDTPLSFFSFDISTSLLLAVVIGFGLIIG